MQTCIGYGSSGAFYMVVLNDMWRVCLCYDNNSILLKEACAKFMKNYPEVSWEAYNEDLHAERKKAFAVKSAFAARATPFCGVLEDNLIMKGFYSEVKECTEANIKDYVSSHFEETPVEETSEEAPKDVFKELMKQLNQND